TILPAIRQTFRQDALAKPIPVYRTSMVSLAIPTVLLTYGAFSLFNPTVRSIDRTTKNEVREDHANFHTTIDNYLMYAPGLAVYALNAVGIKGKHNLKERSILLGMSVLMMKGSVDGLKSLTNRQRPDGTQYNSFPSGHTATAFMGAQFMWEEYHEVSPWYGVAGYAAATATGVMRIYNNRHWFSDVVAGAGIGILSTKAAYWLYPKVQKVFNGRSSSSTILMPTYDNQWKSVGLSLVVTK
ncbi:MAG TPA: phosphatase PAP2 family protein, partial [Chitinophaga sp.]|nr:phosphatase PAP2 family protein [Chitinophaga sp.]